MLQKGKMSKRQKKLAELPRQFSHIMGNTKYTELGFYLLQPTKMKSSEAHIVFQVSEYGFNFHWTLFPQGLSHFRRQILSGLGAVIQ